ncbi:hypothetical protein [Deefgea rivuli]|uniref:hypothetical protein n=1 Tax=Deefgea rivuli TaxID=400948 RepID=UPI0004845EC1|nr:hypothetical protein [Deefgea rivuli]
MNYTFRPFSFGDIQNILVDAEPFPYLQKRIRKEIASGLWWVYDEEAKSYLFAVSGETMFDGPGYILFLNSEFFEFRVEPFEKRTLLYKIYRMSVGAVSGKIKSAFCSAMAIYGVDGKGPNTQWPLLVPEFVSSLGTLECCEHFEATCDD